jgi:hypothetical protein
MKLKGEELKEIVSRLYDEDTYVVFIYDIEDANTAIRALSNDEDESVQSEEWANVVKEMNSYGSQELEGILEEAVRANVSRDY